MTLWIANVVAYSVQLVVLVGAAVGVAALLRIHRPVAALRFWQGVFVGALLWPAFQMWARSGVAVDAQGPQTFTSLADWAMSTSGAETAALDRWFVVTIVGVAGVGALYRLTRIAFGVRELRAIRDASVPATSLALFASELQNKLATAADIRFATHVTSPRHSALLVPRCCCHDASSGFLATCSGPSSVTS